MLKLSKKTEYALMAVKYIALQNGSGNVSAKEISDEYDISYELISKVLQRLKKFKIVDSIQGVKGGYKLSKTPFELSLIDIIEAIEPNYKITECMNEVEKKSDQCSQLNCCQIRDPLLKVQQKIDSVFRETTINQIL